MAKAVYTRNTITDKPSSKTSLLRLQVCETGYAYAIPSLLVVFRFLGGGRDMSEGFPASYPG